MIPLSLMIEGQDGLAWPRWKQLVAEAEELGFAGLFRSDHFTNPQPPDKDSLELIVSLAYLADHTRRIHFGPLVAPLSFRDPLLLVRQAAALDDLSGGRMILGVGAGWQEREHRLFGYELGSVAERIARLREGLEVITQLLHSIEPVTFEGRYIHLRGATLLPRPHRPGGPRILIGGNGLQRTLPLVARYADVWNGIYLTPGMYREYLAKLDELLHQVGREPGDVRRTLMVSVYFGRDQEELDRRLHWRHDQPEFAGKPLDQVIETLVTAGRAIVGTPDMVTKQINDYANAGVEELVLQWFDQDDSAGIRAFAESIFSES